MNIKTKAFTLAEVLVTLSIIGVVAAMTLPTLVQKQQDKIMVNRLKKVYSELQQVYQSLSTEYGSPANWGIGGTDKMRYVKLFSTKMKFTKICAPMQEGCWYNGIVKNLNGANDANLLSRDIYSTAVLSDGTTIAFAEVPDSGCDDYDKNDRLCSQIVVDLNGFQKPNQNGYDIFHFLLLSDRLIPRGWPFAENVGNGVTTFEKYCYNYGHACTAWVLINENMDYKYCKDLSWDGKTKCK